LTDKTKLSTSETDSSNFEPKKKGGPKGPPANEAIRLTSTIPSS
jgi:hypothetical protein